MGETRIVDTFLLRDREMLMVELPAESTAADAIRFGEAVELLVGPEITIAMTHAAVELVCPLAGPPCVVLLGLRPRAAGADGAPNLEEIGRLIAGCSGAEVVLRWLSAAEVTFPHAD